MNTQLFRGLSAFPLTPLSQGQLDWPSFEGIIRHLAQSEVDSITVLGSTGCYPVHGGRRSPSAQGLLLAPVSYHPLTKEEVFGLCETVVANSEVPIILYDNPGTTHFTFSLDLNAAIARLPRAAQSWSEQEYAQAVGRLSAFRGRCAV